MRFLWSDFMNSRSFQSCSRERQSHLESLHDFVSQATQELIWLNEKEEEEVAFDWSDRNSNVSKKRDYHAVSQLRLFFSPLNCLLMNCNLICEIFHADRITKACSDGSFGCAGLAALQLHSFNKTIISVKGFMYCQ